MTEIKDTVSRFDSVLYALPERIARCLEGLPIFIKNSAHEIRLRAGGMLCLTGENSFYISEDSAASSYVPRNPLYAEERELAETVRRITGNSLYAREDELKEGYLTMKSGNRAGVCGAFVGGVQVLRHLA